MRLWIDFNGDLLTITVQVVGERRSAGAAQQVRSACVKTPVSHSRGLYPGSTGI